MKKSISSFFKHLFVFIAVETVFIVLIFRELPHADFITLLGLLHLSYWAILLVAWWIREKLTLPRQKACATLLPVAWHVFIHVYATHQAFAVHEEHLHDEHEIRRIIASAIVLGVLVFFGEYLLHRTVHCESHHHNAHANCHDKDCEEHH